MGDPDAERPCVRVLLLDSRRSTLDARLSPRGELLHALGEGSSPFTDNLFKQIDIDGDGEVSFEEFVCVLVTYCLYSRDDILQVRAVVVTTTATFAASETAAAFAAGVRAFVDATRRHNTSAAPITSI